MHWSLHLSTDRSSSIRKDNLNFLPRSTDRSEERSSTMPKTATTLLIFSNSPSFHFQLLMDQRLNLLMNTKGLLSLVHTRSSSATTPATSSSLIQVPLVKIHLPILRAPSLSSICNSKASDLWPSDASVLPLDWPSEKTRSYSMCARLEKIEF